MRHGVSLRLFRALFGPPTAFRRNGPSVPWVSLPGPTGVMTHPGRDRGRELSCGRRSYTHYSSITEVPDFLLRISCLESGQELVDPVKPTLVHKDRSIADSCLGRYPVSEAETTTDQHGRSDTSGGTRSSFLNVRGFDGRVHVTRKRMMDTATYGEDSAEVCWTQSG